MIPGSGDGLADVKSLAAAVAVLIALPWALRTGSRRALGRGLGLALIGFVTLAALATLLSDAPALSVIGAPRRHNGLLVYMIGAGLLWLVGTALPPERLASAAHALWLGAGAAVLLWLIQLAGWDPLGIRPAADDFTSPWVFTGTLGNPNFAGAFAAAALPAAGWAALQARSWALRLPCLLGAGLLVAGVLGAQSLQAPLAAATGLAVLVVARLAARSRRAAAATLGAMAVAVILGALGLAGAGPLGALGHDETLVSRTWDWRAAVSMAQSEPLTGVGFARFGAYVRTHRPPDDIRAFGWLTQADAAHSVPLDMAAGGGVPLLLAYLALVGWVGMRLVRGLLRLDGTRLLLLGAFGGAWAAYQAQSLVSIDMAQLSLLHFYAAGAIAALTAPAASAHPVPGRLRPALIAAAVAAVALLTSVCAAEWSIGRAEALVEQDQLEAASGAARWAVRLAPWQASYWYTLAATHDLAGDDEQALAASLEAVQRDPRDFDHLLAAAGAADRLGRGELTLALLELLITVEPQAAEPKVLAAEVALFLGRRERAAELVGQAIAFDPANVTARLLRTRLGEGGRR